MSALQCKLVNSCVLFHFAASDETIANCLLERIPWLYLTMVGLTLLVLTLISASTIAHQHRHKKALPSPDEEQHHHNNHYHHHNYISTILFQLQNLIFPLNSYYITLGKFLTTYNNTFFLGKPIFSYIDIYHVHTKNQNKL